ncbi:ATP10 protein-domain-containing protein [Limtongia smithiae]|uniref:ATP10 protein-domain-containing protein n=1 Tax=Limtongia smithiae TaxID=1125753 RepID=UPI0034CDCA21
MSRAMPLLWRVRINYALLLTFRRAVSTQASSKPVAATAAAAPLADRATQLPPPTKRSGPTAMSPAEDYLVRPIGVMTPPTETDNSSKDTRTFAERRADFTNYQRNLERRKEMVAQMQTSYFQDMRDFGRTHGKDWVAPRMYFRADRALYMPNFVGSTLSSGMRNEVGTTAALKGKVSVVKLYCSLSGEKQVATYFSSPEKRDHNGDGYQVVDITVPESFAKRWISKMFASQTRARVGPERYGLFFYARMPPQQQVSQAIGFSNKFSGYVYIVDAECKIRWAASGSASAEEAESLERCLKGVVAENKARSGATIATSSS